MRRQSRRAALAITWRENLAQGPRNNFRREFNYRNIPIDTFALRPCTVM